MNNNSSSFSFYSESSIPNSSFDSPIRAPTLIVLLRAVHDNESVLVNNIPSVLTEKDVDHLYGHYQISRETFRVYASTTRVRVDDRITAKETIIVYEEQLKADLRFLMDLFYVEALRFHKLAFTQLHPNSWRILVAFYFLCFNNNIEPSITLFS